MADGTIHTLSVAGLYAAYGKVPVLSDVSVTVRTGEVVCLTGPNGSGKSTLLSLLAGICPQTLHAGCSTGGGMPSFDGRLLASFSRREVAGHIAFMIQDEASIWNYSAFDIVLSGRFPHTGFAVSYSVHDRNIAAGVMDQLGILNLAERPVHSLSGGEFQKVRIARSLVQEPDILLLDEPAANLDFGYQHLLMETIRGFAHNSGIGVCATVHDLNLAARFSDRIALLPRLGPCESGIPHDILVPDKLEQVYGTRFGVFEHPVCHCPQVYAL